MQAEKAGWNDMDALVGLRLAYVRETMAGMMNEGMAAKLAEKLQGYFRAHLNRDLFVYTVQSAGEIVACAFLLTVEKPMSPAFPSGRTGTVLNVYTRPAYRRQGLGRQVMEALLRDAEDMALDTVDLKATEDGYPLYRALGFSDDAAYRPMRRGRELGVKS